MKLEMWSRSRVVVVGGLVTALFVVLLMRTLGIYPVVFGDEYTYSSLSRLLPFSASYIPGYLYLAIYRLTNLCGDGFLDCARVLNVLFFMAASPFIYMVARRVCSRNVSLWVCALALIAPINSFTIYFMPEPLYFFSFWLCVWFFLSIKIGDSHLKWVVFGLMLGASALIKPHAMFIVPALILTTFYLHFRSVERWFTKAAVKSLIFVLGMFVTKFGISYALAGESGLTLLGNFYTSKLTTSATNFERYLAIFEAAPKIGLGHVLAVCILFGTPLAIVISKMWKPVEQPEAEQSQHSIAFLTVALLLNLIAVVALFSASIVGSNELETAVRLHMRYYDFIFPLFYIAAGAQLASAGGDKFKWVIALPILAVMVYATFKQLAPFTPYMVDSPELRGFSFNLSAFYILATLSVFSLALWCLSKKAGAMVFLIVFMPLSALSSSFFINHEVRQRVITDDYDKAGIFAKQYLGKEDLSKLVIVGENQSGALRALFYIDNAQASRAFPVEGRSFGLGDVSGDKLWLLVIGNVPFDESGFEVQRFNGFLMARKITSVDVSFTQGSWPGVVAGAEGLAAPESWGAWSTAETVRLSFSRPIPRNVRLTVDARAFGPNVGSPVSVKAGEQVKEMIFAETNSEISVEFEGLNNVSTLVFAIPHPISPKDLGASVDERRLGVGFVSLKLTPLQ